MLRFHLCPLCEGPAVQMGWLGDVLWSRCRDCGAEFSNNGEIIEEDEDES